MEISLGVGVGELLFGLTEARVRAILGEEDKLDETDFGCRRLQFHELMLELSFEPDNDGLLGWIEVHNPNATLYGHKLIGQPRLQVLSLLAEKLDPPQLPEFEDYGSFDTAFYEGQWLELQFKFGRLSNLNFGVCYGADDEPLWPVL